VLPLYIQRIPAAYRFKRYRDPFLIKYGLTHINPNHGIVQAFNFYHAGRAGERELTGGCFILQIQIAAQATDAISTLLGAAAVGVPYFKCSQVLLAWRRA
jgi:hypothetical protein